MDWLAAGAIMDTFVVTSSAPNRNTFTGRSRRPASMLSGDTKANAWLGQTVAHIGRLPTDVRSKHMSHFIICSSATIILGTPNGQARTQFEQATQRGFSDECTTPV